MTPLISTTAVGYICFTLVVIFGIKSCQDSNIPSDEATKAIAENCAKAGLAAEITIDHSQGKVNCVMKQ